MNDTKNFTIVMLLVTAAILGGLWFHTATEPAALASATHNGGDYILATGATGSHNSSSRLP